MNGYMGKILRVNLTTRQLSTIDTADYQEWGGGNGMGTAICWDLIDDWSIDGFDPGNVVAIMVSPLSGTLAPSVAGRTEIVGIGVQPYPIGWFTRSNFGGRFAGMLKYAGWDGIVIQGAADSPVWIDVRNDDVQIRDAGGLWGLDTWETQEDIWRQVSGGRA
ncbi:MAG: aldehyde ferredoxin oxidoreductase N-terminal domain-containing protein, partial [Anaerolineae bacterium]